MGKYDSILKRSRDGEQHCKLCGWTFKDTKTKATTGLRYHLERKHPETLKEIDAKYDLKPVPKEPADGPLATPPPPKQQTIVESFSQWNSSGSMTSKIETALLKMMIVDAQPLSMLDRPGMSHFLSIALPQFKKKSRTSITRSLLPDLYTRYFDEIVGQISSTPYVAIGSDLWPDDGNTQETLAISIHCLTPSGSLAMRILDARPFKQRHTGIEIQAAIEDSLSKFNCPKQKIIGMVRDGGSNMKLAGRILGVSHYDCVLHKIALAASSGVNAVPGVNQLIETAKKICRKLKKSSLDKKEFEDLQALFLSPLSLVKSVDVRWLTVTDMFQRFLRLKKPLALFLSDHPSYPALDDGDFLLMERVCEVLGPLKEAVVFAQERGFHASSIIPLIKSLIKRVDPSANSLSAMRVNMVEKLREELQKYEKIDILLLATASDPRFKMSFLANTAKEIVLAELTSLAEEGNVEMGEEELEMEPKQSKDPFADVLDEEDAVSVDSSSVDSRTKAILALEKWLAEKPTTSEKPLVFWSSAVSIAAHPLIHQMAKKYLLLPAGSTDCERCFSAAKRILSDYRKSLSPSTFSQLLFLNQNIPLVGYHI